MNILRRGAIALAAIATLGTTAGLVTAASAGATVPKPVPTHEVVRAQLVEVGGQSVGNTELSGAVVDPNSVIQKVPSVKGDPVNSQRFKITVPTGSTLTVRVVGGRTVFNNLNRVTCAFTTVQINQLVQVVAGTGVFAKAHGLFLSTAVINGFASRGPLGHCNQLLPPVFDRVNATAIGNLSLV